MNQVTQGADWMERSACNNAACFTSHEEDFYRVTILRGNNLSC